MAERESIGLWSTTAASNGTADPSINFAEGQLPGTVNNSNRGGMAALARFYKDINGSLTTAGSANAYTLTINNTWTAYANGQILSFKASFANTATATLNVTNADATALGAKALRGPGDVALIAGQIISGGRYIAQYDTTANGAAGAWLLLNIGTSSAPLPPPGRVTLTTGTGLTASDVTGATSIYYNAFSGKLLSVYNGSAWQNIDVSTDLSCALDSDTGHTGYQQSGKNYDVWAAHVSGTNYFGTGPAWNDGTAGSNTARGTGAGSTEIEWFQGMPVNKVSMTLRHGSASGNTVTVPVRQAVLLCTIRMTADGVTEDSKVKRFVSNVFNAIPRPMFLRDATSSWNYSSVTVRQANANTANKLEYVQCLTGRPILVECSAPVASSTSTFRKAEVYVGVDSITVAGETFRFPILTNWDGARHARAVYAGFAALGYHYVAWLEAGAGTDTQTFYGENSNGFGGIWTDVIG
jgi:hypothetical protein